MSKIIVYSLENCNQCEKAKEFLRSKKLDFTETKYSKTKDGDAIMYLVEQTNWTSFPQIFVDDVFIGGYDHLINFEFCEQGSEFCEDDDE